MNRLRTVLAACFCGILSNNLHAAEPMRPTHQTAVADVDGRQTELNETNKAIWEFAEVGLEETRSSALLVEKLKKAGFKVRTGVADMPTAFVAEFGTGKPVIGILAEYDALPGLSQKVSPQRDPVVADAPGHGCGHSGLGTASLGAALAVKAAIEKHGLKGTVRLYGTPAEETLIGKVYMTLAGEFKDLDACLHWHPGFRNDVWYGESKAAVSAKFTFNGVTAHASGSPDKGRSALDGVELMNVGANFMREHLKEDARVHYVITNGGGAPNVVPAKATVWYYVRANNHADVERNFAWLRDIADGAAKMTRTTVNVQIDTDCHEIIPNDPLSAIMLTNLERVGPPKFTPEEHAFARRLQESVTREFGTTFKLALDEEVHRLAKTGTGSGSTDVGDISWHVPTGGLRTACFAYDAPGHSWQNVAAIGSSIGEKGISYAAKVLACTTLDLLEDPKSLTAAKADFSKRMEERKYITLIPEGQKAPKSIR
ncbi:amidohydrolase [Anatilimnocola floriformis]|uniref:amidohydrolase n=1 Tax=Anatilimnocola floriformis TaxID=2948575 RepID=UPI0020C54A98|nr:amidohydrolase [Anatilimnocola floriformis]